jgi:hypothetical protein
MELLVNKLFNFKAYRLLLNEKNNDRQKNRSTGRITKSLTL